MMVEQQTFQVGNNVMTFTNFKMHYAKVSNDMRCYNLLKTFLISHISTNHHQKYPKNHLKQ